ncbi:MAG TPA: glycosyltransferase family 4 protein [Polyangia bacterium]|jgi:phosphatidylinositol alpha-1,6-mannosyltransferase|nr:glycosyltransferase family 4 protein [Polyangia bacterium]
MKSSGPSALKTSGAAASASDAGDSPRLALRTNPGLAVVTLRRDGGGIAYSSRLFERALRQFSSSTPWLLKLDPKRYDGVTIPERVSFASKLIAGQLSRQADWLLFTHLNIARVQNVVPAPVRLPYAVVLNDIEGWSADIPPDRVRAMKQATLRIGISRYTADRVMRAQPTVGEVVPCPLALLPEPDTGAPDQAALAAIGSKSVLIAGRMNANERYKGHDQLLEAWPAVVARVPEAQLVVTGSGDDVPRLKAKAQSLGIADRVLFLGFVSDATLSAIYPRLGVYAMPSQREGFGLVYLEAMREGVPCIASREDASGDTVVDGETGVLVTGQNPREIAAAIIGFLTDEARRVAFGSAGQRRYHQLFTFDRYAARLFPLLQAAFEG